MRIVLLCVGGFLVCGTMQAWISNEELKKMTGFSDEQLAQYSAKIENMERSTEREWGVYYHVLPGLIKQYGLKVGCEVGVSTGGHSDYILRNTQVDKLYSIDPYMPNSMSYLGKDEHQNSHEVWYYRVFYRLKRFGARAELIRATSMEAVGKFQDESLDFVFIDANHYYEYVKEDLDAWYKKVRSGGLLVGDDYTTWAGVKQAVDEFAAKTGLTLYRDQGQPRVWWFFKP